MKIARIVRLYKTPSGKEPFKEWMLSLKNTIYESRIIEKLNRITNSNFGDSKFLGEGVYELRLVFGPGLRMYYGIDGVQIIVMICGGDKSTQAKDIQTARKYWKDYKERKYGKI